MSNIKDNVLPILSALVVLQADKSNKAAVKSQTDSVAAKARELAQAAHAEGMNPEATAKLYALSGQVAKVPEGTIKAYGKAIKGYMMALEDAVVITTGYGKGDVKNKPMPVKEAQQYHTVKTTPADVLAAEVARKVVLDLIRKRCNNPAVSTAELQEFADMLPAAEDEVRDVTEMAKAESKAAKRAREAAEALEAAIEAAEIAGEVQPARTGTEG